ncbi:MAG: sugar ABC transporter permease [Betaproteobacteria bacterium]
MSSAKGSPRASPPVDAGASGMRHAGFSTVILLAPACGLFALFVVYPIVRSIGLSFYDWNGVDIPRWIGFDNYRELFVDPVFHTALANNLRWLACYLAAPVMGLVLAVFLHQHLPGMRLVRSLFFMPFVISQVVVGLVFSWFFNARFGLLNELLAALGLPPVALLDSERWSVYTMIVAGLWPQTAYCMILYLTGLATLPAELIGAARVDGARGWSLFRHVVVPELRPVHFIVAMVCAVAALRSFDYVMIMTLGGPFNSSTVLAYYMYEQTFLGLRYGYGAAIATVLLALMSCIILMLLWRLFHRERV